MVKSAYRALELLDLLAAASDGLTQTEIAQRMGLAKSTAYELLQTMLAGRYIQVKPGTKRYTLGSRVLTLGARYIEQSAEIRQAVTVGAQLFGDYGHKVRVGVLAGDQVIVVQEFGANADDQGGQQENQFPVHQTALGKALLCRHDAEAITSFWERLEGGREHAGGSSNWEVFRRDLDETALLGIAFEAEEHRTGIYSLAVPIFGLNGEIQAAVAVYLNKFKTEYSLARNLLFQLYDLAVGLNGHPGFKAAAEARNANGGKFIYATLPNLSSQKAQAYLQTWDAVNEQGGDIWLMTNSHDDEWKQQLLLELVIAKHKPNCAVIVPVNAVRSDELFKMAAQHKVPAVCFQRPSRSRFVEYYVGGDGYDQGELQLEYIAKRLKGRGRIVILEGDPYNDNARNMVFGYQQVFARYPKLELAASVPITNWSREEARQVIAEILSSGEKLDAVVAGTDQMAAGVIEELRKRKLNGKVFVVGGDGDLSAVKLIGGRELHATVFQHPTDAAEAVYQVAAKLASGTTEIDFMEKKPPVHGYPGKEIFTYTVSFTLIDAGNVRDLEQYWLDVKNGERNV